MKIFYCQQRTPEWHKLRAGMPTASQFHRIITSRKEYAIIAAKRYCLELIGEEKENSYVNDAMQYGIDKESEARAWFSFSYGLDIEEVGFILSDCGRYGCSPDGIITHPNCRAGLEIKCPQPKTMQKYLSGDDIPHAYYAQIQGSMLITGFDEWYFMAYRDDMPPEVRIVKRDEPFIRALSKMLDYFLEELNRFKEEKRGREK